ncbi:MAG: hypothetical protein ACYCSA_10040 [Thermoplasmataceae archaeon]
MGLFGKKRHSHSTLFATKADGTYADKEKAIETTLEARIDEYRFNARSNLGIALDLVKRLATLSILYRGKDDMAKSSAHKREVAETVDSLDYPNTEDGKAVRKLVKASG